VRLEKVWNVLVNPPLDRASPEAESFITVSEIKISYNRRLTLRINWIKWDENFALTG
jgi:hypothetical protein